MKDSILFSIKIILFGFILPFKTWQLAKKKLINHSKSQSLTSLLDEDYIVTSWLDYFIDAIIFLMYPIGIIIIFLVFAFTKASFFAFLGLIPLYFFSVFISWARELGGSFMLLHLNIKQIKDAIKVQDIEPSNE